MTKKHKKKLNTFLNDSVILLIYAIAFVSYCVGFLFKDQHWIMLIPIICYISYDIWFTYYNERSWGKKGRCKMDTLDSIRSASTYTSYFLAFVALSISLLADGSDIANSIDLKDFWIQIFIQSSISP